VNIAGATIIEDSKMLMLRHITMLRTALLLLDKNIYRNI